MKAAVPIAYYNVNVYSNGRPLIGPLFVVVNESRLGTKICIIIKTLSKQWWKHKLEQKLVAI